jgi:cell division transport system ATP-binding protein
MMLKFSNVTKSFFDKPAVDDVSFEMEPGELIVLSGASGSGKTTLLKLLTREYDPDQGEIYFKGDPVHLLKGGLIPHHRRRIGAVFQDYKLLQEMNVWENIALALSILGKSDQEIEKRVTDLLNLVELPDKAYLFPNQLSGGEAQRIAIARALATAPELIFADEPTGNLDAKTSAHVAELLGKINELGTTVLVTTHDPVVMESLKVARKLELEKGKLINDSGSKAKTKSKSKSQKKEKKVEEKVESSKEKKPKTKKTGFFSKLFGKKKIKSKKEDKE